MPETLSLPETSHTLSVPPFIQHGGEERSRSESSGELVPADYISLGPRGDRAEGQVLEQDRVQQGYECHGSESGE